MAPPAAAAEAPQVPGLVVYASEYDVDETAERVESALSEAGMVTATLDHQANAESVGAQLRPTTLVIGGAPQAGTPLLQEAQEVGIDLPQKFLTWQDRDGGVWLAYNSAAYLATQAGIATASEAVAGLEMASAGLAAQASGTDAPASEGGPTREYEDYRVESSSDTSVPGAVERYHAAFAEAGPGPLATVDHQAGAGSIGERLRPTRVTYVGNPELGTPLIAARQTVGIDLPTRYLAWQEENGQVGVAHVNIDVIAERHGLEGQDQVLAVVAKATAGFTAAAAGPDQVTPVPQGGVDAGGGGTAGPESPGLLTLGVCGILVAAGLGWYARRAPREG